MQATNGFGLDAMSDSVYILHHDNITSTLNEPFEGRIQKVETKIVGTGGYYASDARKHSGFAARRFYDRGSPAPSRIVSYRTIRLTRRGGEANSGLCFPRMGHSVNGSRVVRCWCR